MKTKDIAGIVEDVRDIREATGDEGHAVEGLEEGLRMNIRDIEDIANIIEDVRDKSKTLQKTKKP